MDSLMVDTLQVLQDSLMPLVQDSLLPVAKDSLQMAITTGERFTGIAREGSTFNHNLLISILLLLSIAVTWFFVLQKESVTGWFRKLSDNIFSDAHKATLRDQFGEIIILLIGMFGISLLSSQIILGGLSTWKIALEIWLLCLGFLVIKILLIHAYFSTLFPKKSGLAIYKYLALSAGFGLSCLLIFIGLYFTQDYLQVVWYVIAGITILSYFISLSYVLIRYFFNRLDLIFHFILYLCTLELLPIFLVLKVAL